jgi:hypothetical protein
MRASLAGLVVHARTGSRVRSLPLGPAVFLMKHLSRARLAPFAPYHWLMYGKELYFDIGKAERELCWQPKWGNVEMLCESYDWYLKHRESLAQSSGSSLHRSPVRPGVLRAIKRILP